jgi:UPF0716 protein FxsA
MAFSLVPFMLLAMPIAEISVFILVGSQIGLLPTLGLILVTAIIGSVLLRVQGFGIVRRISEEARAGRVPGRELIHGVMIVVAGVLLLTPGFISDTIGFLLFVPAVRDFGWRLVKDRIVVVGAGLGAGMAAGMRGQARHPGDEQRPYGAQPRGRTVIDLDEDDFSREPSPDSPWRDDQDGRGGPKSH